MANYIVLVQDNIKRSITLFNIGIIAEFWLLDTYSYYNNVHILHLSCVDIII